MRDPLIRVIDIPQDGTVTADLSSSRSPRSWMSSTRLSASSTIRRSSWVTLRRCVHPDPARPRFRIRGAADMLHDGVTRSSQAVRSIMRF